MLAVSSRYLNRLAVLATQSVEMSLSCRDLVEHTPAAMPQWTDGAPDGFDAGIGGEGGISSQGNN